MWAKVPETGEKDWIKNIYTQERPWGEQNKMIWHKITEDAGID